MQVRQVCFRISDTAQRADLSSEHHSWKISSQISWQISWLIAKVSSPDLLAVLKQNSQISIYCQRNSRDKTQSMAKETLQGLYYKTVTYKLMFGLKFYLVYVLKFPAPVTSMPPPCRWWWSVMEQRRLSLVGRTDGQVGNQPREEGYCGLRWGISTDLL